MPYQLMCLLSYRSLLRSTSFSTFWSVPLHSRGPYLTRTSIITAFLIKVNCYFIFEKRVRFELTIDTFSGFSTPMQSRLTLFKDVDEKSTEPFLHALEWCCVHCFHSIIRRFVHHLSHQQSLLYTFSI